ncbi:MAG: GNAT family N-acetyltransferase [Rickettsiales bacterium]|nr:GNAT family N-acetyltransferase [Pseudomonadota bacterium]MDG4544119.1 GNAT family N-acetyltransferase [Rickettsiales bacterium]MDG4546300.1 GNAT family N-acetyltransferase [Rickettsiales bacterium]MDG4548443.1 GNAT family N-acetyltransferase [Rickettsiales bacterium]
MSNNTTPQKDYFSLENKDKSMSDFYDLLYHPVAIISLLIVVIPNTTDSLIKLLELCNNKEETLKIVSVGLLSTIVGFRLLQCVFLAKRDYSELEHRKLIELFVFLILIFYTAGGPFLVISKAHDVLLKWSLYNVEYIFTFMLSLYLLGSLIGSIHFYDLWKNQIKNTSNTLLDVDIAEQVQLFNFISFICTFVFLTLAFIIQISPIRNDFNTNLIIMVIISSIILICNIIHSHDLTFKPKFLIHNKNDSIHYIKKYLISYIKNIPTYNNNNNLEKEVTKLLHNNIHHKGQIEVVRAKTQDIHKIANEIYYNFGHIYEYIFDLDFHEESDKDKFFKVFKKILLFCNGFGSHGLKNYYIILNQKERPVGFFKIDCKNTNFVYQVIGSLYLFLYFIMLFGPLKTFGILKRLKEFKYQDRKSKLEVCLNYLVIYREFQRQGYGTTFLSLLIKTSLNLTNNGNNIQKITAVVRSKNKYAKKLFQKNGFKKIRNNRYKEKNDKIAKKFSVGKSLFYVLNRN